MRLIHISDTHLGYQAYDMVNDSGINTREQDVYDAFEHAIDRILEIRPDVVIHSGDFFHRPSPSNRALTIGLEQLRRLSMANIPIVIIAGNHETPKTIYNSPILRAMRTVNGVYPIHGEQCEKILFDGLVVHVVPHFNEQRVMLEELTRLEAQAGVFNLLMLHTSLGKKFLMDEYGEQVFPSEFEVKLSDFQYIALGHWHNCQKIDLHPSAWYSGSTERMSDTEIGAEKGFLVLEKNASNEAFDISFEAIPTRSWLKLDLNHCHQKTLSELYTELDAFIVSNNTQNAIISLNINDIKPEQSLELSNSHLKKIFPDAFHLIPRRRSYSDHSFVHQLSGESFDSLDKIFEAYILEKLAENPTVAHQLVEKAKGYFAKI